MQRAGLYIHIPFCRKRCTYCDFYSEGDAMPRLPRYIEALKAEINLRHLPSPQSPVGSVYFGGGTPSLLSVDQIEGLLQQLKARFSMTSDCEVTLEANPGTLDLHYLEALRNLGINRLSLGVQSFLDDELQMMGRIHSSRQVIKTIDDARSAGFDNLSIDLIYGLPGQSLAQWTTTLKRAIALAPDHISAYTLTWSEHTPLGRRIEHGALERPDEETVATIYETTVTQFANGGYAQYEVSNFARPGYESVHNRAYWSGRPYLGLGASAHGFLPPARYWNHADLDSYIETTESNQLPEAGRETLSKADVRLEEIALGLRRREGIALALVANSGPLPRFVDAGWLTIEGDRVRPTSAGLFRADGMATALA